MSTDYIERSKQISADIKAELSLISKYCDDYAKAFPTDIRSGIFSSESDTKALNANYYSFISSVSRSLSRLDDSLLGISTVILDADRNGDTETIRICDQTLNSYNDLRTYINDFARKNETDILNKCFSAVSAYKYLNELNYKLSYFLRFLDAQNI